MQKMLTLVVAGLVLAGGGCWSKKEAVAPVPEVVTTPVVVTTTVTAPVVQTPVVKKPTAPQPTQAVLDYNATVKVYDASGYRLQIVNCSARPGAMVVKRGMKFMIDNRDDATRTIAVGTQKYTLKPYGWTVTSVAKAGQYNITCNGGGAGSLNVQQ